MKRYRILLSVIKYSSRIEFRDANLPGYELRSRGIELSRVFGTGRGGMHIGYWWESQKERDRLEDQDVDGWTVLKWILER
jgi:hypothetical protein